MLMLRALLAISGEAQRLRFLSQQLLVKSLNDVAEAVKSTKESLRLKSLLTSLEPLHQTLQDNPTSLPLSPSLLVNGIQVRTCSYFASNTLPLKLNFLAPGNAIIPAIFKVGDDLQQDMLTLQVVRIMDKLWLREGLDLKMVAFGCVPTGHKRGKCNKTSLVVLAISDFSTLFLSRNIFYLTSPFSRNCQFKKTCSLVISLVPSELANFRGL